MTKKCQVDGCVSPPTRIIRGYCGMHYQRVMKHGDPHKRIASTGGVDATPNPKTGIPEYIESRIIRTPTCWLWIGRTGTDGYAEVRVEGVLQGAHRYFYEFYVGQIPDGLEIDHLCQVRNCMNPAHLEPVTPRENKRRTGVRRTHCPSGHEYTASNTAIRTNSSGRSYRKCRKCEIEATRRYKSKKSKHA